MPPIQTTYASEYTVGLAGQIANQETHTNVISLSVQDASLAFGTAVFQGSTDNACTATVGGSFRGIACIDKAVLPFVVGTGITASAANSYQQGDTAGVLTKGVVWVVASVAVTVGQAVYVTSGGLFTNVSSGDTALANATFDSSAAAGALVKVRIA